MNMPSLKPLADDAPNLADQVAGSAHSAIRSTQGVANAAFDSLTDKIETVRGRASPAYDRLASQAEGAARRSMEAVRETSAQLRQRAALVSDNTVGYIQEQPVRSVLIAAAAGAALMALLSLFGRSRGAAQ